MGDRLLLRRQRTQACAVSQTGNGRRRGRRHKEPKPTRRRGSCVAAPEKGKLLVRVGQRGASGGDARGAEKGAQPHNRPRLAARRAGGQNNRKEKATVSAGHRSHLSKDKPFFIFLGIYEPDMDMATVQVLLDCLKSYWCS